VEGLNCGLLLKLALGLMKAVAAKKQMEWLAKNRAALAQLLERPEGRTILRVILS
jgi:hypothetical protein